MRGAFLVALAALLVTVVKAAPAAPIYDQVVAATQTDPGRVDFGALRRAYAASPGYDPDNMATRDAFEAMWKAFTAGDCTAAMAKTDEVLKLNFTYVAAHIVRSECLNKAGDAAGAARETAIGRGLAESILASGDGKSPATAYVVYTLDEEHLILAHEGLAEQRQALLSSGGHSYDEIDGAGQGGAKGSVFFQIDEMFAAEGRAFGGKH